MKNSKVLTIVLALVAIAALVFGFVTNGQKGDLNKQITDLKSQMESKVAELTKAKDDAVAAAKEEADAALKAGTLHPFAQDSFTVGGAVVEEAFATDTDGDWTNDTNEGIVDGYYHESEYISAPSFGLRIDGIIELN